MPKKTNIIDDLWESLTVSEVALACQVSRVTVNRWIGKGHLPAIRPPTGGPWRINQADFWAFMGRYKSATTTKEGEDEGGEGDKET